MGDTEDAAIDREEENAEPNLLTLFCGAGGMTVGFENAGYNVIAGVDYDVDAVTTFDDNIDARAIKENLAEVDPDDFAEKYYIKPTDVDVIVGGPPCQGFSKANAERDVDDPRNNLVFRFAKYVDYYHPNKFLMENVKGIMNIDDGETVRLLVDEFEEFGYAVEYRTMNAANYGVPQTRERVFFQGQLNGKPTWPKQTHVPKEEVIRYE